MLMDLPENETSPFDQAAMAVVELGNQVMDQNKEADAWDVAWTIEMLVVRKITFDCEIGRARLLPNP